MAVGSCLEFLREIKPLCMRTCLREVVRELPLLQELGGWIEGNAGEGLLLRRERARGANGISYCCRARLRGAALQDLRRSRVGIAT